MSQHQPNIANLLREIVAYCREAGHEWSSLSEAEAALSATQPAQAAQGEPLCDDEGCDHHGTPHVCVNNKQPAQGAGEVVPYAYAVYFPDQPTEMLVHDLDDLCDDMTNREHTVTPLYTQPADGADVQDAVSPVGDWSYSHDEERFSGQFDTKEEAIAEGLSCGARFVGQVNHVRDIISDEQIGWDIFERIGEILGDEIGEVAECFTLSRDQQEALGKVVLDWIESGPGFNCWGIKDVEPIDAAIAASGRQE